MRKIIVLHLFHFAFKLVESKNSPSGVIIATLKRAGDLKTGSFGI